MCHWTSEVIELPFSLVLFLFFISCCWIPTTVGRCRHLVLQYVVFVEVLLYEMRLRKEWHDSVVVAVKNTLNHLFVREIEI